MGLRNLWKRLGASPPPPQQSTAEVRSQKQEVKHDLKAPFSGRTELHTCTVSNSAIAQRPKNARLSDASLKNTAESSSNTTQTQTQQVEWQPEVVPGIESTERQRTALSKSQRLWNAAYDSLEEDEDTADLVTSYVKTLTTVLGTRPDIASGTDASANLKDSTMRQIFMKQLVEEGLAKISTPSKFTKGMGDVAQFILSAKGSVDAAIQNIPQAALPWAGVCVGLQILMNPAKAAKSNIAGIVHVVSRMDWYCALTDHLLNEDSISVSLEMILPQLEAKIIALYKALLLYQMKSVCSYYRHQSLVLLRSLVNKDDWDIDLEVVEEAEATLQKDSDQYNKFHAKSALTQLVERGKAMEDLLGDIYQTLREFLASQKELQLDEIDRKCRWDLRVVDPRDDMKKIENKKDTLLPDAYEWVLDTEQYARFMQWNDQPDNNSSQLLWIKGHAGTGKTMLLMGIIRSLEKQQDFCAPGISYFFCQGTDVALNNATAALRSLVWMLVVEQPHLISHLREKYINSGTALFQDQNAFFALYEALLSMLDDPELSPVLFVVDALDECDRAKPGLNELMDVISASIRRSDRVKWLISSRPEIDVLSRLKNFTGDVRDITKNLVELDAQRLAHPVDVYIDHKLVALEGREGYDASILAEISNEVRQRAMNTFLWVSLAFQHIEDVHGEYAVQDIKTMPPGLLELYDHMMTRIENVKKIKPQDCKKVLVCAVLAFRPVSLSELAALCSMSHNMTMAVIESCGSFLAAREGTVYLIHQSAKDYLDKNFDCRLQSSGIAQGHVDVGRRSIAVMSKDLKQNIYGLDNGFKQENVKHLQPDPLTSIRYSCVFWAEHFVAGASESPEGKRALADDGEIIAFLRERVLHWLECLSILERLSEGLDSIRKLLHIAQESSQLVRFLKDIETFIQSHGSIIARAPLQTYASALVFSPTTSEVRVMQWKHRLPFIQEVTGTKTHWDAHRQTLEGHSNEVVSVVFSPDGKTLASASFDMTIRLWDATTGSHQQTLKGHNHRVHHIAFSPNSKILASASHDQIIHLWDIVKGSYQTIKGLSSHIMSMAFLPDGKKLAIASGKSTIWLWDITKGSYQTLDGPNDRDKRFEFFSLDGKTLISVLDDNTIQVWDIAKGSYQMLNGHSNWAMALAFSPDGKTLASASNHKTIQLWNIAKGSYEMLKGHTGYIRSMVFSPNGKLLASASDDKTIRLWDASTGSQLQMLKGHSDRVWSVAFLPNSNILASASDDKTIRLWDITIKGHQMLNGHTGNIRSMVFSPNGKLLASASDDKTIRLWDAAKGSQLQILEGHSSWVMSVAFSPSGEALASASGDETIRLWDITTGSQLQMLKGHSNWVISVAFSPDGKTLASVSDDKTIRLWDAATGSQLQIFRGHSEAVTCIALSPTGRTLASASNDETIRLWDVTSGNQLQTLKGHSNWAKSIAFSPDGKTLAAALMDKTIRLWDTATGSHLQTFVGHSNKLNPIAFSSDGRYLTTDHGPLQLVPTLVLSEQRRHESSSNHTLCIDGEWVALDGKKSLWLPVDYRPSTIAVSGNKMVLGHESGGLTFLEVNFS